MYFNEGFFNKVPKEIKNFITKQLSYIQRNDFEYTKDNLKTQ